MDKIRLSLLLLGMLFATLDAMAIGGGGSCCVKKTVGGVAYTLVSEDDTTKYGCQENCIYTRDNQPGGTQICFKAGDLEPVCNPDKDDQYLYLSDSKILRIPEFAEVTCNQEFPEKPLSFASGGVVTVNGKKELQVCGGEEMTTCQLWTEDGWVETATGFNRAMAGASTVGGSIIVTGGKDPSTNEILSSSKIYTEDDGWLEYTSLPAATMRHCQVTVGDNVYVVGGVSGITGNTGVTGVTGDTYRLSLSSKQWVKQSSLNTPRFWHGCVEWDGGVLVVGGAGNGWKTLSSVEKYNPGNNKWSTFTPLPTTLYYMQVLVWDNDLYVFGGRDVNNVDGDYNKKVYRLKKGEETWETLGVTLENNEFTSVFPAVTLSTIHCT